MCDANYSVSHFQDTFSLMCIKKTKVTLKLYVHGSYNCILKYQFIKITAILLMGAA